MFYVIDLSKPIKRFLDKYDDAVLDLKLHPAKTKKIILTGSVVIISLAAISGTVYAIDTTTVEYQYLLDHYMNNLHYPKDIATEFLNRCNEYEMKELYTRAQIHNNGINNFDFCLNTTKNVLNICSKTINAVCKGIDYIIGL